MGLHMDARKFTRVNFSECASLLLDDDDVIFCDTKDVSLKGMFLLTNYDVRPTTEVDVKIYDSGNSVISVKGMVVRSEKSGIGIQIKSIDINSFVRLRNIIAMKCSNFDDIIQETYKMSNCIH